jgi:hypothetical protein
MIEKWPTSNMKKLIKAFSPMAMWFKNKKWMNNCFMLLAMLCEIIKCVHKKDEKRDIG